MVSLPARLRRILGSSSPLESPAGGGGEHRTQIDSAWVLSDGSLCVDGWLSDGWPGGPLEARLADADDGHWRPLLRKSRPDVADSLGLRSSDRSVAYGFVGHVAGHAEPGLPVTIEFRSGGATWQCPVHSAASGTVPESVFVGVALDGVALSPEVLAPIVDVIRQAPVPERPGHLLLYDAFAGAEGPWLSVVVPFYGDFEYLRNLLIAFSTDRPDGVELVLVCDDPDLTERLDAWLEPWNDIVFGLPVQLLAHERNSGFAAACNTGWSAARGEIILLLNSDVLIARPARDLRALADCLNEECSAVAPVLLFPDGTVQHAGMLIEPSADFPGFHLPAHPGKHQSPDWLGAGARAVPMLSGAAIMTTLTALKVIGGVPLVFGKGDFEDVLLSVALRDRGAMLMHDGVVWTHVEGASYRREDHGGVPVTLAKSVVIAEQLELGR
jgi:GT2 family glycosyltransferase